MSSSFIFAAMTFDEVIGLTSTKQQLIDMVIHNRLSHANLIVGTEGNGSLPLAIAFAQYLVSLPVSNQADSLFATEATVNQEIPLPHQIIDSKAYLKANALTHPDLHFSFPTIPRKPGDKPTSSDYIQDFREFALQFPYANLYDWLQFIDAENKQGKITAEECNDIVRKLSLKAYESDYKVIVIWMPECLGKEGNKLLKLIEEPPDNTIFLLVAEQEDKVLPTIVSRCRVIKTGKLTPKEIQEALVKRCNIDADKALTIANMSNGSYREALLLLQHAEEDQQALLKNWLNIVLRGSNSDKLKISDELSEIGREKQKQFLHYFLHLLEVSFRVEMTGHNLETGTISETELDMANKLRKVCMPNQLIEMQSLLNESIFQIERNANTKLLFLTLTIKLVYIIKHKHSIQITA